MIRLTEDHFVSADLVGELRLSGDRDKVHVVMKDASIITVPPDYGQLASHKLQWLVQRVEEETRPS